MEICAKGLVTRFEQFSPGNYIFRATFDFYFLERLLVYCQKKTISTLNVYSEFYQRKCEVAGVREWPELPKYTLHTFVSAGTRVYSGRSTKSEDIAV